MLLSTKSTYCSNSYDLSPENCFQTQLTFYFSVWCTLNWALIYIDCHTNSLTVIYHLVRTITDQPCFSVIWSFSTTTCKMFKFILFIITTYSACVISSEGKTYLWQIILQFHQLCIICNINTHFSFDVFMQ